MSKECETFSNPIRTLITALVLAEKEMSWSQIKEAVEKITGSTLNPNTLSFHLGKLVDMEYIQKVGTKEQPAYRVERTSLPRIINDIDPIIAEVPQRRL
jgi:DNA-binding HxlR family transcriptional regulator